MTSHAAKLAEAPSARAVALDLLCQVLERRRPLDELLDGHDELASLEPRDRAFVHALAAMTLRRLGQIDALLAHCLSRPLPGKASTSRNLLRLGVAQLLFLGTPPHAAVSETVELAHGVDGGGYAGLINAVLRRLAQEGPALREAQDAPCLNTPGWLWRSWREAYGEAVCRAVAEAHLADPPLDLTAKADAASWAARLDAELLPTGGLRRPAAGEVRGLPGFADGAWWVQDAAAALPARLLGEIGSRHVLDLCAAPGGKTAQLAAAGANVTAIDRSPGRLRRVGENLARLGLSARLLAADAGFWRPESPADAVLLDAPCTATGTIRRHPDVARLKTPADVLRMASEQARLLRAAIEMVKPGGIIVFTTCSLELAEGPAQIAALLAAGAPIRRRPIAAAEIGGLAEFVTAEGDLRTLPSHWPERGGIDGFYAARLERL
ncbi:MAG TPA: transcription antitermination factor NusB [Alphaproteobacteria bacterium]|nr:transcription antitermination factor NusB [Alphaproteobacteria bacterium]